jgi:hypothetical protein
MIFKKLISIPDVNIFFPYSLQKTEKLEKTYFDCLKFYQSNDLNVFEKKHLNHLIDKILNKAKYPSNTKIFIGTYFFLEKKGFRIQTNSNVFNMLNFQDSETFFHLNYQKFLKEYIVNDFEILKNFKFLKSEFVILCNNYNTTLNFLKAEQKLKQLDRIKIPLLVCPKKWIPYKGMLATGFDDILFNPYSKTPKNLKNKVIKNFFFPTKIKEFYCLPTFKKEYRYLLVLNIKQKVWDIQTKYIIKNLKYLGTIYVHRPAHFFIVGIDGVPVFLHWKELDFSHKKKTKILFKFTDVLLFKIFAKYKDKKRINLIVNKKIVIEKNFELIFSLLITAINSLKKFSLTKNLYKKK